jgi:hypothetical protein
VKNFGRGANHPTFFLRKFISMMSTDKYRDFYVDFPQLYDHLLEKLELIRKKKNTYTLKDLREYFGNEGTEEQRRSSYLNSKIFYNMISEQALELIMEGSKCNEVLNHLISIEKYSSRLGNPLLTGRVEFQ